MLRRGVCWNKKNKRWQAAINSSGKYLYLGSFTNEDDAAKQFDRAAIKLRGKKAKLNFEYQGGCARVDGGLLWLAHMLLVSIRALLLRAHESTRGAHTQCPSAGIVRCGSVAV